MQKKNATTANIVAIEFVILDSIAAFSVPRLFIGPHTFFPQIHSPLFNTSQRQEFSSIRSISRSTSLSDHLLVHFLKLFAQLSLIRHVYNNPEKRKRTTIVWFLKKLLQGACAEIFTRPTLLRLHANGRNLVALRFADHRTIEIMVIVRPKVWPVSNCTQQVPTLLRFHANGRNKSQHCWGSTMLGVVRQQCWVHLHGP